MKIVFFYLSQSNDKKKLLKIVGNTLLIVSGIVICQGVQVHAAVDTSGVESIGYEIWRVLKRIALFVLAGFTVRDILRELNDSSLKDIASIVGKYAAAWVVIVFIIRFFLWIDGLAN